MKDFIKLIRIKHWIKNILVFIPLISSHSLTLKNIILTTLAFFAFSFISSSIYIINDIKDKEKDKLHKRKKNRPIASGRIAVSKAVIYSVLLFLVSFTLNMMINPSILNTSTFILLLYFIINLSYSLGLKNVAILDVVLLASGFILRVYYGASVINVEVSNWLFLTILNASLYIGLGKRKKEILIKENVREVLKRYNENFLNNFMNITLTLIMVFYSLWVTEQPNKFLFLSIPLLLIVFMEYSLYIEISDEGDPVTVLFNNPPLLLTSIIYALFMGITMVILWIYMILTKQYMMETHQ